MFKKFFLSSLFILFLTHYGSAQDKVNFQAILLDNGSPMVNASVEVILAVSKGSTPNRQVLYQESHQSVTNATGIVSLTLGTGSPISGSWGQLNWANDDLFLETYLKRGSTNQLISASAIHSVPKALHAEVAKTVSDNAIISSKIEDAAITNSKLATGSVDSRVIVNGSITAEKLASGIGSQSTLSAGQGLAISNEEIRLNLSENYHRFFGFYIEHPTRIDYASFDSDVENSLLNNADLSDLGTGELKTFAANYLEGLNTEFPLIVGQVGDAQNPKGIVFSTAMSTESINAQSIQSSELSANDLITDTISTSSEKVIMNTTSLNEIETVTLSADRIEGTDGLFEDLTISEELTAGTLSANTIKINEVDVARDFDGYIVVSADEIQAGTFIGDGSQLTGISGISTLNDFDNIYHDSSSRNLLLDTSYDLGMSDFSNSQKNLGLGNLLFPAITNGSSNISIGNGSFSNLEDGTNNISIGESNMSQLVSGYLNIAIGDDALDNITGQAVNNVLTGYRNIGIGSEAGKGLTASDGNIAIGSSTLSSFDRPYSGSYNVAIGENAGSISNYDFQYDGSESVFIGYGSGPRTRNAEGVAIGNFAQIGDQYTVSVGGDSSAEALKSIALGANARVIATADYSIAIGSNVVVSDPNTMQLGSPDSTTGITTIINVGADMTMRSYITPSDRRLKTDIKPIENSLDYLNKLNPVSYRKKGSLNSSDYKNTEYGFIAQEVQVVLPEMVIEIDKKEGLLGLDYNGLIALLAKAIQEQQQQITELQKQLNLLNDSKE